MTVPLRANRGARRPSLVRQVRDDVSEAYTDRVTPGLTLQELTTSVPQRKSVETYATGVPNDSPLKVLTDV